MDFENGIRVPLFLKRKNGKILKKTLDIYAGLVVI